MRSERRAEFAHTVKPEKEGYIRLYNKNAFRTSYYKIIEPCKDIFAWIVEPETEVDPYWINLVKPVE